MKKTIITLIVSFISIICCACNKSDTPQDIDSPKPKYIDTKDLKQIKVIFIKEIRKGKISLVKVKRWIKKDENESEAALKELFLGPTANERKSGVRSEIPIGTRLLDIEENDNDITVNISDQYLTGGGAASVQLRYTQLYNTISTAAPGKKIYLNIDGKEAKTIAGEGLEVSQPLKEISDYIKESQDSDSLQP